MIALILFSVFSCKEKNDFESEIEVAFKVTNLSEVSLKSASSINPEEIPCKPYLANYVKLVINGTEHKVGAFYIVENGYEILYTNALRLSPGDYSISSFTVWHDNGTPNNEADDIILSATPNANSFLAQYVDNPLNVDFSVHSDRKTYVDIDVICYNDEQAADFGFFYAGVSEITVQSLNFFGDFCMKKKSDYVGSLYEQQVDWSSAPGEFYDAPTIAKIQLWKKVGNGDWVHEADFSNSEQGESIKVIYSSHKTRTDSIMLKLFVYVRIGTQFDYKHFHTWKFKDNEKPAQFVDNSGGRTTYYAIGSCSPDANYIFPGWVSLPPSVTYQIVGETAPGSLGGYVDASLTNTGAGYEFGDGLYRSFCADHTKEIVSGTKYDMDVYSSLYVDHMPVFARSFPWEKINWLINHIGLPGSNNLYPGHDWDDLQGAIWLLGGWNGQAHGGVSNMTPIAQQMASDANANFIGYIIPTGGWAAVAFIPAGTSSQAASAVIQTVFIEVDP